MADAAPQTASPEVASLAATSNPAEAIAGNAIAKFFQGATGSFAGSPPPQGMQVQTPPTQYQPPIQVQTPPAKATATPEAAAAPGAPSPSSLVPTVDISSRYDDKKVDDAAPAALPEIPKEQDIRLPENTAENVGHAFAQSRAEAKQYRQLAEQLKKQIEDERAKYEDFAKRESAIAEQLTAEQNRSKGLEEEIGRLDLSRSPEFREKYDAPLQQVESDIFGTFMSNGYQQQDAAKLARSIIMSRSMDEAAQFMSQLPDLARGQIAYKFAEADGLWAARQQAIDEWRSTQEGLAESSNRETAVVSAQRRASLASESIGKLSAVVSPNLWADAEFQKYLQGNADKAKAWFGQAPATQVAEAAIEGMLVAPFAYKTIEGLSNEIVRLRSIIDASHRAGSPSVAPMYSSVPLPPPPPRPAVNDATPKTVLGNPVYTPVTQANTGPVETAAGFVGQLIGKSFRQ